MPSVRTQRRRRVRKPSQPSIVARWPYARSTIPTTMRAAAIDYYGGPNVLAIHTMPVPQPNAHEVLIAVDVAGVGSWDPAQRSGKWKPENAKFPLVLGSDGAGTVVAVGDRVTNVSVGDFVYGFSLDNPKGGWYAEYVAVPANRVALTPAGLNATTAGAVPSIGLTALQGVDDVLEIAPDEHVVILGASGNVGMLALQFAKRRGARVLAIASGDDGVRLAIRLGADAALDGRADGIEACANSFAPDGTDAVLAYVGGPDLTRCLDTLKSNGRVAYPNGIEPEPRKRRGLRMTSYDGEPGIRQMERLNAAVEEAHLQVPIAARYPLEDAARAHERIERGHVLGRVVLEVRSSP